MRKSLAVVLFVILALFLALAADLLMIYTISIAAFCVLSLAWYLNKQKEQDERIKKLEQKLREKEDS